MSQGAARAWAVICGEINSPATGPALAAADLAALEATWAIGALLNQPVSFWVSSVGHSFWAPRAPQPRSAREVLTAVLPSKAAGGQGVVTVAHAHEILDGLAAIVRQWDDDTAALAAARAAAAARPPTTRAGIAARLAHDFAWQARSSGAPIARRALDSLSMWPGIDSQTVHFRIAPTLCGHSSGSIRLDKSLEHIDITCGCQRGVVGQRCSSPWRVAWALAEFFVTLSASRAGSPFQELLRDPVASLLEDVEHIAAQAGDPEDVLAVGWRIDGYSMGILTLPLAPRPVQVSRTKAGRFKTKLLSADAAARLAGLRTAVDREVQQLLELTGTSSRQHYGDRSAPVGTSLAWRRLVGHPWVFHTGGDAPVAVVQPPLTLALRGDGTQARLYAELEGEVVDVAAAFRANSPSNQVRLRWALTPTGARLQVIAVDERLEPLLAHLGSDGIALSGKPLAKLRERVPMLATMAPLQADDDVLGAGVAPQCASWLRLRLAEGDGTAVAVHAEITARPLQDGPFLTPAAGEGLLFGQRDGQPIHTRRDFAAERAAAEALRAALALPALQATVQGEAALELVAAASEQQECPVVWERDSIVARRHAAWTSRVQVRSRTNWLEVGGKIELDGDAIDLAAALVALREGRRWVRLAKSGWLRLEGSLADALEAVAVRAEGTATALTLPALAAELLEGAAAQGATVAGDRGWGQLRQRVAEARAMEFAPPPGLQAELRDYQRTGIAWLQRLAHWAPGAALADDMGLGKTLQALGLLLARAALGPALVVAPTSLGPGWLREAGRFAPSLRVRAFRGGDRRGVLAGLATGEVLVTSYDLMYRDIEDLATVSFATVVFDEVQALKNHLSRRAAASVRLQAGFRLALSGTPVENHVAELWSVMRTTVPGLLPGWERFRRDYATPIERQAKGPAQRAMASLVGPFVLRRRKAEVLRELPERLEVRVDVVLSPAERAMYDAVRAEAREQVARGSPEQRRFAVLVALTRLRQAACHPKLVLPDSPLTSAKHGRLRELVAELREEGQRALVFSQFVRQLELVRELLAGDGVRMLQLDGSTPAAQRGGIVDAFQRGEADVLLLSLKAGGTGLNLTAASTVILLDPWWNPAVEAQAGDRAHRIGQHQNVTIVRLVALGTVEDAILELQADKRELTEALLAGADGGERLETEALLALLAADAPDAALAALGEDGPAEA